MPERRGRPTRNQRPASGRNRNQIEAADTAKASSDTGKLPSAKKLPFTIPNPRLAPETAKNSTMIHRARSLARRTTR